MTRAFAQPQSLCVHVTLDDAPHYKGSIHEDAVARARGYKAALLPGAFVYGHVSRVAIRAWGLDWAKTGAMSLRFRRPVYDQDDLTISVGGLFDTDSGVRCDVTVANAAGETVASGWIAMPAVPVAPPERSALLILPAPDHPPAVQPGGLVVGAALHTRDRILTAGDFHTSLSAFEETDPIYGQHNLVHCGMLMRLAMGDTNSGWRFPAPVVLVSVEAQHFATVHPGQRVRTAGRIAEVYEHRGNHYFVAEEYLIAGEDTVAARFLRTQIYGIAT